MKLLFNAWGNYSHETNVLMRERERDYESHETSVLMGERI